MNQKLLNAALVLTAFSMMACDESSTDLQENTCPTCEKCQKCEECQKCGECTVCNDSQLETRVGNLTAQLETCNGKVKALNGKTRAKNGSRLKVLSYKGNDGSEAVSTMFYDTLKHINCSPIQLDSYLFCGNHKTYCAPAGYIYNSKAAKDYPKFIFCPLNDNYTTLSQFNSNFKNEHIYHPDEESYYLDDRCEIPLAYSFIKDDRCQHAKNDIFYERGYSKTSATRLCVDNTTYTETESIFSESYRFYKIKTAAFKAIYSKSGSSCYHETDHGIFLEPLPDNTIATARDNKKQYCEAFCAALESEMKKEWVEMTLETIAD